MPPSDHRAAAAIALPSTPAGERIVADRSIAHPGRRRAADWIEANALFIAGVAAVAILSLVGAATHLNQDGWLALVSGRLIAQSGIPHHDFLTVMAHGVRWVDQQWLSQLLIFDLWRIGGYALYVITYVGL